MVKTRDTTDSTLHFCVMTLRRCSVSFVASQHSAPQNATCPMTMQQVFNLKMVIDHNLRQSQMIPFIVHHFIQAWRFHDSGCRQLRLSRQGTGTSQHLAGQHHLCRCPKLTGVDSYVFCLFDIKMEAKQCKMVMQSLCLVTEVCFVIGCKENIICIEKHPWHWLLQVTGDDGLNPE